jgi:hypothetical protein
MHVLGLPRQSGRHLGAAEAVDQTFHKKKLAALRIEIDDYSDDPELKKLVREYNDPLTGFIDRMEIPFFLHHHRQTL